MWTNWTCAGDCDHDLGTAQDELESLEQLYSANPKSALAANNLAWNLMMAPEPLCDVNRAIELAEQAVRDAPGTTTYRNTLGAVLFHAGQFERAIEFLKQNVAASPVNELPWDLYYLAKPNGARHWTRRKQAEMYLQMANRWSVARRESQPNTADPQFVELLQLKTEASCTSAPGTKGRPWGAGGARRQPKDHNRGLRRPMDVQLPDDEVQRASDVSPRKARDVPVERRAKWCVLATRQLRK